MIERLQRALEHINELPPEAQEDIAAIIEEQTEPLAEELPSLRPSPANHRLPRRIRTALAAIGSARDLQDDDEFEALDLIRHGSPPSPPLQLDDL